MIIGITSVGNVTFSQTDQSDVNVARKNIFLSRMIASFAFGSSLVPKKKSSLVAFRYAAPNLRFTISGNICTQQRAPR